MSGYDNIRLLDAVVDRAFQALKDAKQLRKEAKEGAPAVVLVASFRNTVLSLRDATANAIAWMGSQRAPGDPSNDDDPSSA